MKHGLNTDEGLLHESVTKEIIGSAFEVHNVLRYGFLEKVYQKALQTELQQRGRSAQIEQPIQVNCKGVGVGSYFADLFANDSERGQLQLTGRSVTVERAERHRLQGGVAGQFWPDEGRVQTFGLLICAYPCFIRG